MQKYICAVDNHINQILIKKTDPIYCQDFSVVKTLTSTTATRVEDPHEALESRNHERIKLCKKTIS